MNYKWQCRDCGSKFIFWNRGCSRCPSNEQLLKLPEKKSKTNYQVNTGNEDGCIVTIVGVAVIIIVIAIVGNLLMFIFG